MHKIFQILQRWLLELLETEAAPDPLNQLTPREFADLPVHHPGSDRCLGA